MKVIAAGLNLRSAPVTDPDNIILVLPRGHEVETLNDVVNAGFREIQTIVNGVPKRGFVSDRFVREELSRLKERLVEEALNEWDRFGQGMGMEFNPPFFRRIGEYFQALGIHGIDGRNRDSFWSAAFISFITRQAGYNDFVFSESHARYILDAKRKRINNDQNAPFWLFKINEHRPQIGDMICQWRETPRTFDNLPDSFFPAHCDVIVEIVEGIAKAIGGNVGQSVNRTNFSLDDDGFIRKQKNVFAVMRNNR
ncbi:SH3 domain-containing C40 family peptidase [Fibrella forsythiae]|uniref:DUF2272 domain-containing protein n=1 Tax=Fibrella forsythiae TaxID=2817061 RepID=A0ABS3JNT3_9BACT|nr:SH3 domain-containing C40 family peptidase [Fibrella forsythiae]MBO0950879.1 DUF2272 domain-containing protein [Fibrella forsythiae]